jgi:hypothetical protein
MWTHQTLHVMWRQPPFFSILVLHVGHCLVLLRIQCSLLLSESLAMSACSCFHAATCVMEIRVWMV